MLPSTSITKSEIRTFEIRINLSRLERFCLRSRKKCPSIPSTPRLSRSSNGFQRVDRTPSQLSKLGLEYSKPRNGFSENRESHLKWMVKWNPRCIQKNISLKFSRPIYRSGKYLKTQWYLTRGLYISTLTLRETLLVHGILSTYL